MNVKIVFFIQNFSRAGGSERAVSLIANELANRGYDISILSICGDNTCFFNLNDKINLYTLVNEKDVDNRKDFIKVLWRLKKFYSEHSFNICIDVFASLSIYTLLLKKCFNIKNITWEHYNYLNNMGLNKIGRKFAIGYSDLIVTLTESDRNNYLANNKKLKKEKIYSIFNATPYPNANCSGMREKFVIAIGRLEKLKGFDQLLDIWNRIFEEFPEWKLLIIGEGDEHNNLLSLINEKKILNAELLGKRNDVDSIYSKASIYVSTSKREGLPMTMIEAQSFGLPIVSFDYETGPKEIITDGEDGYIIGQGIDRNKQAADKLSKIMSDNNLWKYMSQNAKKNSDRFDINNIGDEWEILINKITGGE